MAFSPDGTKLITAGGLRDQPGQLKIWSAPAGEELRKLRGIQGVRAVVYAPDGKTFVTGDFGGDIKVRDADKGDELRSVHAHDVGVNSLALSADGQSLASAGLDTVVKLWDAKSLKFRKAFHGHQGMVYTVACFRNANVIVSGGEDNTAKIWDVATGKERHTLRGHKLGVEMVAISPDDTIVVTASWDRTIKFWDAATGMETGELKADSPVFALAFTRDGKQLVSTGGDGTVRLWDMKKRELVKLLGKHIGATFSLAFSRDDKYLASGSHDNTAKIWDMKSLEEITTLQTTEHKPIHALAYSPDGQFVAMVTDDRNLRVCNARSGNVQAMPISVQGPLTCVAYSRDGKTLATGSLDNSVTLTNRVTGKQVNMNGHTGPVRAIAFAPDGKKLPAPATTGRSRFGTPIPARNRPPSKDMAPAVLSVAFSLDGGVLASGSEDSSVRVWQLDKSVDPILLKGHEAVVRAVAFSRTHLATADDQGVLRLWRSTGEKRWKPVADAEPITMRATKRASRPSHCAQAAEHSSAPGRDANIIVWDTTTGQPQQTLKGHKRPVTALAIHPQGRDLVTGGMDTMLYRWQSLSEIGDDKSPRKDDDIKIEQPPKKLPRKNVADTVELFEDATDFLIENLDNNGGRDGSVAARDEKDFFSGKCSLSVSPFQRFKTHVPGWNYPIKENPQPGEYRYARFAWKRTDGQGILLQLFTLPKTWEGYYAGTVSRVIKRPMIRIADEPPRKWELVTRDLYKDFGSITITGINFSAMEGPGVANFDHMYLARTIEDLDRITEGQKQSAGPVAAPNVPDETEPPPRNWTPLFAIGGSIVVLLVAAVLLIVVIRRRASTPATTAAEPAKSESNDNKTMIAFACHACGKKLKATTSSKGKSVKCPHCGERNVIPASDATS